MSNKKLKQKTISTVSKKKQQRTRSATGSMTTRLLLCNKFHNRIYSKYKPLLCKRMKWKCYHPPFGPFDKDATISATLLFSLPNSLINKWVTHINTYLNDNLLSHKIKQVNLLICAICLLHLSFKVPKK